MSARAGLTLSGLEGSQSIAVLEGTMAKKKKSGSAPQPPQVANADGVGVCFVIMPFGGYFDSYYEKIYKPAIEAAGLLPVRADSLERPSSIINDIWRYTVEAKVVLAELTTRNPNVFYELGLAHAAKKPAVLISQTIDDVPFDLRSLRVLTYTLAEPRWADKLQERIEQSLRETIAAPAAHVLPTFLDVKSDGAPTVSEIEALRIELRQDVARLEREMAAARSRRSLPAAAALRPSGEYWNFLLQTQMNDAQAKMFADLAAAAGQVEDDETEADMNNDMRPEPSTPER